MPALTPNRVAAVTTWLTAAGAFAYAIVGSFPQSWQPTTVIVAALATKAAIALKFMAGSQNLDRIQGDYALYKSTKSLTDLTNVSGKTDNPLPDEPVNTNYEPDYALAPEEHV